MNSIFSGIGYYWIVFIVGVVAGIFCVVLLVVWAYTNARKMCSCIKSNPNNENEDVEGSCHERSRQGNDARVTNIELTPISSSENTVPMNLSHLTPNTNQEHLPPKYEDIESHPIVKPYPISSNSYEDGQPPKYEDILNT